MSTPSCTCADGENGFDDDDDEMATDDDEMAPDDDDDEMQIWSKDWY